MYRIEPSIKDFRNKDCDRDHDAIFKSAHVLVEGLQQGLQGLDGMLLGIRPWSGWQKFSGRVGFAAVVYQGSGAAISNTRYQWAMQWENVGSGAPQWRLWNGTAWQAIGVPDNNINPGTWYTLTIDGDIVNGKVHYMDFIIHGTEHSLSQYTFSPTSGAGDGLIAAIQLDGNSQADPYQLYVDNAHFYWK